jgi:small conductance mechanosensitive channel
MNLKLEINKIQKFLLIAIITLTIVISWTPKTLAQFSLFSNPNDTDIPETPSWDLNKAVPCGKYWCSHVHLYGDGKIFRGELVLGNARDPEKSAPEIAFDLEQRAKFIQNIFQGIFINIIKSQPDYPVTYPQNWQFWLFYREKPLHPLTPIIEVGTENQQTVVYVAAQPKLGLAQQAIATVTKFDAKVNAIKSDELAQQWRNQIRNSLSQALWGYEMDRQYPGLRFQFSLGIALLTMIIIFLMNCSRKFIKKWDRQLRRELAQIAETLRVDPEAISQKEHHQDQEEEGWTPDKLTESIIQEIKEGNLSKLLKTIFRKSIASGKQVLSDSLEISKQILPKVYRETQSFLKQELNFTQLLLRIVFLSQLATLLLGISVIITTFRQTRFLSNLFLNQALILPLIWIGIVLLDKLVDFVIDYYLNQWAMERQERFPNSNRPTLRVNTYSPAIQGATSLLFIALGILLTGWFIGINPRVVAGVGAFTVVFAFISRNLLEDMLNGTLILITDRYAVGDVVDINGLAGYVEKMNLYTTCLRNLDGQLIIIPNGKVATVINMTKEWSRVNFTIEIGWDTDIHKTIKIIKQVTDQIYKEPEWQEKILEPADILGIERVSHEGIMIRLLVKTLPSQQWTLARELRMRIKKAFDLAGISLGIPQREIWHHHKN